MKQLHRKILGAGFATILALGLSLSATPKALAATTYAYNPSDLISDSIFTNSSAMSASAIQSFLNKENSGLKSRTYTESCNPTTPVQPYRFTYYPHCGKKESAATIIYDAGRAYGINPRAILATMQKEQSLVTTPNPAASQINCAMGYNSCSGFTGFFAQVDNGTWQLRTDIELMDGRSWWGYAPNSYPCATSTSLYSTGLYPGRTVKFADPGGKAETVKLDDSSTAALYCYTPYVGPYSTTGYSGSYNFVQSFEQWWGSTVYAYAGNATVTTYSDTARTQPLSLSGPLPSGTKIYVTVSAVNTGGQTWSSSFTHVATEDPTDRTSPFQDGSWLSYDRPARLTQSSVAPTQTGTFEFSMTTPNTDGEYNEHFGLVADGQHSGWMDDDSTFNFNIDVSNPYNGSVTQLNIYRDSGYSQPVDVGEMSYGEKVYVQLQVKNTGTQTWSNSFTKVATENPENRTSVFADGSWLTSDRPAAMVEPSVAPGQTGTFRFSMTAPNTDGTYNESFGLVADGQASGWMPGPTFSLPIRVVDPPFNTLYSGITLYPGQSLATSYRLAMQYDGNLVLYNDRGKALWATGTNHKGAAYVRFQSDGNLVVYTAAHHALWASRTNGKGGTQLRMQYDGNLVMYNANNKPVWATGTNR